MGKSQKKRLLEAHNRTMKKWLLIPYVILTRRGPQNMLHIESR